MKLSELITKLEAIKENWGDHEVEVNNIGGERAFLKSICIEDNSDYADSEDERYTTLLEVDRVIDEDDFIVYEHPSMETVDLDNLNLDKCSLCGTTEKQSTLYYDEESDTYLCEECYTQHLAKEKGLTN